jgi:hypothetical protein
MSSREEIEIGPLERSWGDAIKNGHLDPCPSASELIDFVESGPASKTFGQVVQHLGCCPPCRNTVLEMRSAEAAIANSKVNGKSWLLTVFGARRAAFAGALGALAIVALAAVGLPVVLHRAKVAKAIRSKPPLVRTLSKPKFPGESPVAVRKSGPSPRGLVSEPSPQFLLVGSHHVYRLDSSDSKLAERKQIEESYADSVAAAWGEYVRKPRQARSSRALTETLREAGDVRDRKLGALFQRRDDILADPNYPKLEGAAPYQVLRVDYKVGQATKQPAAFVVLPPWPDYHPPARPYGWEYNHRYEPESFRSTYRHWHAEYVAAGKPAFTGLVGHRSALSLDGLVETGPGEYAAIQNDYRSRRMSKTEPLHREEHSRTEYAHGVNPNMAPTPVGTPHQVSPSTLAKTPAPGPGVSTPEPSQVAPVTERPAPSTSAKVETTAPRAGYVGASHYGDFKLPATQSHYGDGSPRGAAPSGYRHSETSSYHSDGYGRTGASVDPHSGYGVHAGASAPSHYGSGNGGFGSRYGASQNSHYGSSRPAADYRSPSTHHSMPPGTRSHTQTGGGPRGQGGHVGRQGGHDPQGRAHR